MRNRMKFIWRSKTMLSNVWTSAVLTVLVAIIVSVIVELTVGHAAEEKITHEYLWPFLGAIYLVLFIVRWPIKRDKGSDSN